ncbi:hypothetical protein OUZ56_010024 [Daphnia magna]|uniref:Uncharacterized protein n=1 Tax=Daphnia magna TaxID=35525 RepID=A0ABR0AHK6_9CRUS|nr:hypothetical protein OUZ56_010024 [Daphnia magna]
MVSMYLNSTRQSTTDSPGRVQAPLPQARRCRHWCNMFPPLSTSTATAERWLNGMLGTPTWCNRFRNPIKFLCTLFAPVSCITSDPHNTIQYVGCPTDVGVEC